MSRRGSVTRSREAPVVGSSFRRKSRASVVRLHKIIDLLERGQVVFSRGTTTSDNLDDIMLVADSDDDCALLEMEHQGFAFTSLRTALSIFSTASAWWTGGARHSAA
jgi:hypothetical protein